MINPREQVLRPFIEQADFLRDRVHSGIEQNRKGWFTLTVKDADGNPLPGAAISLTQKTHEFRFGANCFMLDEMETPEKNAEYKRLFADCFNLATLPFYWDDLEPEHMDEIAAVFYKNHDYHRMYLGEIVTVLTK